MYTGADAEPGHEGHAQDTLILAVMMLLWSCCYCCLIIRGHFDRRRRRPRTAPQDEDDSDGDFEPGPRTTTASVRRRSPRLARQNNIGTRGEAPLEDAVEWNFDAIRRVLEGIAALSAVVYTVGVGLGLPPY